MRIVRVTEVDNFGIFLESNKENIYRIIHSALREAPDHIDILAGMAAIAIGGQRLFVVERGAMADIPLPLIRRWESEIASYQREIVTGFGPTAFAASYSAPNRSQMANTGPKMASGLYIQVADVEHPMWQFKTTDMKLLNKWNEILKQAMVSEDLDAQHVNRWPWEAVMEHLGPPIWHVRSAARA